MSSPFENIDDAFAVLFDTQVRAVKKNGQELTLTAAVFQCEDDEPLSDEDMDVERDTIQLTVARKDWGKAAQLDRGCLVFIDGTEFKVQSVRKDFTVGYTIRAREK